MAKRKFYRITYSKKCKEDSIVNFDFPNALKIVHDICTSAMVNGPTAYLVTEITTVIPYVKKEVVKYIEK